MSKIINYLILQILLRILLREKPIYEYILIFREIYRSIRLRFFIFVVDNETLAREKLEREGERKRKRECQRERDEKYVDKTEMNDEW